MEVLNQLKKLMPGHSDVLMIKNYETVGFFAVQR